MASPPTPTDIVIDDSNDAAAAFTTPGTTPTNTNRIITGRMPIHRSFSHGSAQWSATDTPQHHHQGTSYASVPREVSPTPRRILNPVRNTSTTSLKRRGHRSTSVTSSNAPSRAEDTFTEEDEEDVEDDQLTPGREGATTRREFRPPDRIPQSPSTDEDDDEEEDDPITLKDRQSLINVEHPFGLPIWKPALYKKSRSVTRDADQALHSVPSAQAERHLIPGNIVWAVVFGWWMSLFCLAVSAILYIIPYGGKRYSTLIFGLGWYLVWPFGKYVEGDIDEEDSSQDDEERAQTSEDPTISPTDPPRNGVPFSAHSTITPRTFAQHESTPSWEAPLPNEATSLLGAPAVTMTPSKSYGATPHPRYTTSRLYSIGVGKGRSSDVLGRICFWLSLVCVIAPIMLVVCAICWALVFTIPMARLNWALIKHLFQHPTEIRFCAAPAVVPVPIPANASSQAGTAETAAGQTASEVTFKPPRLAAGQAAPSGGASSTVLLCTYRAFGWKYYKYTVGGVNILFINLLPIVFFVLFDGFVLLPIVEERMRQGKPVTAFLAMLTSRPLIFLLSLTSVIPLSYFIGMAVASISAQSSIGMGAVINATFGSIIEIILYAIALTQGKGHLVEGSIVGSLLAGVLLMPGMSMCSSAIRRKEQKFNAKSAGVTSMLLIMAFIGTLTPTLFYQTYGSFQLVCDGCPENTPSSDAPWVCQHCYYEHPDPADDPFYQSTVKKLMYFCAIVLVFSYLIGLWFSLRTHASQIWQNPQQLLHPMEVPMPSRDRVSVYHRLVPNTRSQPTLQHKPSTIASLRGQVPNQRPSDPQGSTTAHQPQSTSSDVPTIGARRISYAEPPVIQTQEYDPVLESVDRAMKDPGLRPTHLPESITPDDFTRAVAVATVSALRHQQQTHAQMPQRMRVSGATAEEEAAHGGHDAPSWSRTTSASVLLACTALYAVIADLLVEVVDVVLEGSGIDEKFLGVTLFALVPNTTEFMNAMSFALNGNIALSMEIGSAYALQVCLLQIPAMVAFSAWYAPEKMGSVADTFTLIFPRWDVVVIILSVFLMTYTYIEAKSNYHRGSILILSYLVLTSGFFFAPQRGEEQDMLHSLSRGVINMFSTTRT